MRPAEHGISHPLDGAKLRVLSLGAGVQSSTLALMAARGDIGPMPDCAIFADTGAEPASVYRYLERLTAKLPFPVHIVSAGDLRSQLVNASHEGTRTNGRPPLFVRNSDGTVGMTRRQCTQDFKILPIRKKVRELLGLRPRQRGPKTPVVEQWIGISTDEIVRLKRSREAYSLHRWPLIEHRMSRQDCLIWLAERQYEIPGKSACTFCPYHSDAMWRAMRDSDPQSWSDACAVDASLRSGKGPFLKGEAYLHRSAAPLAEADLSSRAEKRGQADLLEFADECDGMCGT